MEPLPAGVQKVLDAIAEAPAFVWSRGLDLVAANYLGYALYAPLFSQPSQGPVNIARFKFLDPAARTFFFDWENSIGNTVALLRTSAGMLPSDEELRGLVEELSQKCEPFRRCWEQHDVRLHWSGVKEYEHPVVGRLTLPFETLTLPARPELLMSVLTAEPGSASARGVRELGDRADSREHSAQAAL
ncbi:hypothetical protein ACFYRN_35115 [Streptomyces sp. NPDC005227]|uniref:MmyB family transcriptional regulator n=1 Tax=unclassified Streptomyces TaxID=2593676 RepID=UPI0036A48403